MSQKAKRFLKMKTNDGSRSAFTINQKRDGGIVGSLVGLGYIVRERVDGFMDNYRITFEGLNWIGK